MRRVVLDIFGPRRTVGTFMFFGLCLAGSAFFFFSGCDSRTKTVRTNTRAEPEDPLAAVHETLRKDRDREHCKDIVAQLNNYLLREGANKPVKLSEAERDMLTKRLNLSAAELKEVERSEFTILDANYIEECLLLQDSLRWVLQDTADAGEANQLDRAQAGFAWVMRQVWRSDAGGQGVPPSFVLRRGSGTDSERAAVALAVFQIMGLDACLIARKPSNPPLLPWAVGARIDKKIYLFDPRGGQPIPGLGGKGIATLADAQANPDLVKAQAAHAPAIEPKLLISESAVFISPPLSAVAPRMRLVENLLKLSPPVTLALDLDAMAKRFTEAGAAAEYWSPANDHTSPVRSLAYFLPEAEGGFDRPDPERGMSAIDQYGRTLVPWALLPPLLKQEVLAGEPSKRLTDAFRLRFLSLHLEPKKPRDLVLRGHFDEATRDLVEITTTIANLLDHAALETDLEQGAREWAGQMLTAAANLKRAEDGRPGAPSVAEAKSRVEALYKDSKKIFLLIERAAGDPHAAQATFLLALTKHEQAVRLAQQARDPQDLRTAWQNAESWWNIFLTKYESRPWLARGQVEHARTLLAQARQKSAAVDVKNP